MSRLVRCLRRTVISTNLSPSFSYRHPRVCLQPIQNSSFLTVPKFLSSGSYVSEMRKSAFEGNILRLIRSEIQSELDHSPPLKVFLQLFSSSHLLCLLIGKVGTLWNWFLSLSEWSCLLFFLHTYLQPEDRFGPFTVDERPGEQWVSLRRKFGDTEDIKIEATMFDGSVPSSKSTSGDPEDIQLHITFVVNIFKDGQTLEIMCSAWPDTIQISKFFVRKSSKNSPNAYVGPEFEYTDLIFFFLYIKFDFICFWLN